MQEGQDDDQSRQKRRHLLQRLLPIDDDSLKQHLQQLVYVAGRIRSKKVLHCNICIIISW